MVVKASFSEAAANTVIDPDTDAEEDADAAAGLLVLGDDELPVELLLDEQPVRADAVIPAIAAAMTVTVTRRTMTPKFSSRLAKSAGLGDLDGHVRRLDRGDGQHARL